MSTKRAISVWLILAFFIVAGGVFWTATRIVRNSAVAPATHKSLKTAQPIAAQRSELTGPPNDIVVPDEPAPTATVSVPGKAPDDSLRAVKWIADCPTAAISNKWAQFAPPDLDQHTLVQFLESLTPEEILALLEYICTQDSETGSTLAQYAFIPVLKQKWSQTGAWQDTLPFEALLAACSDPTKPSLFRKILIDLTAHACRNASLGAVHGEHLAHVLHAILRDPHNPSDLRAYAVLDLALLQERSSTPTANTAQLLRSLSTSPDEPSDVRAACIAALGRLKDPESVTTFSSVCNNYADHEDPLIAKAAVVALANVAASSDHPMCRDSIAHVATTTSSPEVLAASLYALSLLDGSVFVTSLPTIMGQSSRLPDNHLIQNSRVAALARHRPAILAAIRSENSEIQRAGINAACLVPVPEAKSTLEGLLATHPSADQATIRMALDKASDIEAANHLKAMREKRRED